MGHFQKKECPPTITEVQQALGISNPGTVHKAVTALEITDGFTLRAAREYLGPSALPDGDAHLIVEIDGVDRARGASLASGQ